MSSIRTATTRAIIKSSYGNLSEALVEMIEEIESLDPYMFVENIQCIVPYAPKKINPDSQVGGPLVIFEDTNVGGVFLFTMKNHD